MIPKTPAAKPSIPRSAWRGFDPALGPILLVALALRLWGVAHQLPSPDVADRPMDDTTVDESDRRAMEHSWAMWYGGTKRLDLNPGTGDWPGLPFYVALGSQMAYRAYDLIRHPGTTAQSFRERMEKRPTGIFLAARLPSILLGLLSIFLIYVLALELADRGVARFASGFLAVMPFHVWSSQRIADPNLLSLVFMTAAAIFMVRLMRTRSLRDSIFAGAFVGLAAASKYLPIVLLVPLALAHAEPRAGGRPWLGVRWKPLAWGAGAAALAFLLTSPYTLLRGARTLEDIQVQQGRLTAEWAGLSSRGGALLTYLTQTIPEMMTWPGYALAIAGGVLLWRRGREGRVALLVPALFLAGIGGLQLAQPRFVLPAVGMLAVPSAIGAFRAGRRIAARRPRSSGATAPTSPARAAATMLPSLVLAGLVIWGTAAVARTQQAMSRPDSRHEAHAWVKRNLDPKEMLALDEYGPVLQAGPSGRRAVVWPFAPTRYARVSAAYHAEWLDGMRHYLTSSEVTRRYQGQTRGDALERSFHEWIREHGTKVWSTDPRRTFGPQIDVYRLPNGISTGASRDSLWALEQRSGSLNQPRIGRWTAEISEEFLLAGEPPRAEEWARRGLDLPFPQYRQKLYETLALSLLQQARASESEAVAREGSGMFPSAPLLRVTRGMALESLGRAAEAVEAYRSAIPLSTMEGARQYLAGRIQDLEAR